MLNAYEVAIKIIHWYKGFDLYNYRNSFSDSENEDACAKILAEGLINGENLIEFLTDCKEETELPEEKKEIIKLINMIKTLQEAYNET